MDAVVDVELFANDIVKELGFCCGTYHAGFLFKPPFNFTECSDKDKHTNTWLTRYLHEIPWEEGYYGYTELATIIDTIKRPNRVYYAKGLQKCRLLATLFDSNFINLEDTFCPGVEELLSIRATCDSYLERHAYSSHCAQRKAIIYHDWMTNNEFDLYQYVTKD